MSGMSLFPVAQFPLIHPGDDLAALIVDCLLAQGEALQPGDILVVAQKVVSKAEGRLVELSDVTPSREAEELAAVVEKDPRHVQVILDDSRGSSAPVADCWWWSRAAGGFAPMQAWTAATSSSKTIRRWRCCPPIPTPVPNGCGRAWPS